MTVFEKLATLGGDPEQGFEQAFAALAYEYIKSKAPALLNKMVGFQLVDRDEDDTKAFGIFGFKAGKMWLYSPIFFLTGDLKGHELLYIRDQRLFVPMKEAWVNYLLKQQPQLLGEADDNTRGQRRYNNPDFNRIIRPPLTTKYSAQKPMIRHEWAEDALMHFAEAYQRVKKAAQENGTPTHKLAPGFDDMLRYDPYMAKIASDWFENYPALKWSVSRFYQVDNLMKEAAERVRTRDDTRIKRAANLLEQNFSPDFDVVPGNLLEVKPKTVEKQAGLITIQRMTEISVSPLFSGIDGVESERDQPSDDDDGVKINDRREMTRKSETYNLEDNSVQLVNPEQTGIYQVLMADDTFETCWVLFPNEALSKFKNNKMDLYFDAKLVNRQVLVVKKDSSSCCAAYYHPQNVWVSTGLGDPSIVQGTEAWEREFEKLPKLTKSVASNYTPFIGIDRRGNATPMLRSASCDCDSGSYDNWIFADVTRQGEEGYIVGPKAQQQPLTQNHRTRYSTRFTGDEMFGSCDLKIKLTGNTNARQFTMIGDNTLMAPEDAWAIKVEEFHGGKRSRLALGTPETLRASVSQKTAACTLEKDANYIWVRGKYADGVDYRKYFEKKADARIFLVGQLGLDDDHAKRLIKVAEEQTNIPFKFRIKYAQGFGLPSSLVSNMPLSPVIPELPYGGTFGRLPKDSIGPMEEDFPVEPLRAQNAEIRDPYEPIDPETMRMVQQSAQRGDKEIMDISMFKGLLKNRREDRIIPTLITTLINSMSKVGETILVFYWQPDVFKNRYGKQELPELEDSLRNTFDNVGDLALFLREKEIRPFGMSDMGPNLEESQY